MTTNPRSDAGDGAMSKLSHSNPAFEDVGAKCERCGEMFDAHAASVEAWERFDMLMCPDCWEEKTEEFDPDMDEEF